MSEMKKQFTDWLEDFKQCHEEWKFADSDAMMFNAWQSALSQQPDQEVLTTAQTAKAVIARSQKFIKDVHKAQQPAQPSQTIGKKYGTNELLLNNQESPKCNLTEDQIEQIKSALDKSTKAQPSCDPDIFAWACWPDGMPMEKSTASLCGYDPKAYKRKIPLYVAPPDYESLRAENERLKQQIASLNTKVNSKVIRAGDFTQDTFGNFEHIADGFHTDSDVFQLYELVKHPLSIRTPTVDACELDAHMDELEQK